MSNHQSPVLLFDGVCNLCNATVQFVIRQDPEDIFQFASLQSEAGQAFLKKFNLPTDELNTVVLVNDDKAYTRSDVVLQISKKLGGWWRLMQVFYIVPRPVRNVVYDWIARNRYRWFGKKDECWLPTPELKRRFLS